VRIVLLFPMFHPDELGGCALYADLARYLYERGHEVIVITTFAFYPRWRYAPEDQHTHYRIEEWEGITIHRMRMYVPAQPSGIKRILSDLSFLVNVAKDIPWKSLKIDIALTAYPTLGTCLALGICLPVHIPRMLMIQDFVVDAALELGMLKTPFLDRILLQVERWALSKFNVISSISPQMVKRAEQKADLKHTHVIEIPNWIHRSLQERVDSSLPTVDRQWDKPIMVYSGNLGIKQGLGDFLKVFIEGNHHWTLVIRGQGCARRELESAFPATSKLQFADLLEEDNYCVSLLQMPLMLITQKVGSGESFLPSKLLSALIAGVPVLAFCESMTPLALEVTVGGYGWVVDPNISGELDRILSSISTATLQEKSHKARQRSHLFHREHILQKYEQELLHLVDPDLRRSL
jgi:colanic acid biosynthesis glycosyl transferase WcaI